MTDHAHTSTCHEQEKRTDWLLRLSAAGVILLYVLHLGLWESIASVEPLAVMAGSVFELINIMWWSLLIGIAVIGVLGRIPREFIIAILGNRKGVGGMIRATLAGFLLDLCSHGILMVAAKLYERGASTGQVIAFLVSSPWNSFSLTLILIALIGLKWTGAFILFSMGIAILTGLLFDFLVRRGTLPANPNRLDLPEDFRLFPAARKELKSANITPGIIGSILWDGLKDSRMVLRWILFGILLAALVRVLFSPESFGTWFGPSLAGLGLTVLVATILEICSEGSTPLAADLLTRAKAPGNAFAFLMAGVATDYTEVVVLKDTTKSWKIALFLPLITLPQILLIAWVMNIAGR